MSSKQTCKSKVIWTLNLNKNRSYIALPKNDCVVYGFRVLNLVFSGNPFPNASILHISCPQLCEKTSEGSGYHVKTYGEEIFCGSPIVANYVMENGNFKYYPQKQPEFKFYPIRMHYILFTLEDENGISFQFDETNEVKIILELLVYN
jgi:hypothetical protein